ncbi:hypothetical protein [Nocardia sp. NPDC051832]|uniref:hypothetical protein n=1 Tax=Nocardia sp. NPDC051832 TaxID=3155673 RepID=UPI00341494A7
MSPTPTAGQFRKASASSPQQACVMVFRDEHRTLLWDDKLADPAGTSDTPVPPEQCLTLNHDQFEAVQAAIRAGTPVRRFLTIIRKADGHYLFGASPQDRSSIGTAELCFDHAEYTAFVHAVCQHEFDQRQHETIRRSLQM